MSAWILALGLSAGYLVRQNMLVKTTLETAEKEFNKPPADGGGRTSEIRQVQREVPVSDRYQDMNLQDLSRRDVASLNHSQQAAANAVIQYENPVPLPEIQGVWLNYDNRGI